jgi:hypothetical protein
MRCLLRKEVRVRKPLVGVYVHLALVDVPERISDLEGDRSSPGGALTSSEAS